jgi:hypothetical protein
VRVLSKLVGSRSVVLAMALSSVLAMVGCAGNGSSSAGSNITATPTLSPGAGTYKVSKTVTIGDTTSGAVLYCTTDGTTPTTSSPRCAQPTTVFQTEFLQAIAVAPGKAPSVVASAGYTISPDAVAAPIFTPAGGNFTGPQMVTVNESTSGANVYYTLDGTTPSASSTLYTGPVAVTKSLTLSAVATAASFADSPIVAASYTIQAVLSAPTVSSIAPTSANAGGGMFTLTVNGTGFVSGATVQWNGVALTTTYGTATQLTAVVPASLIASAGTANVTVAQSSGISGVAIFTINSVAPTVAGLNPTTGAAGASVTITGANFTGATAVNFGGIPSTSFTVNSATSITAVSPAGTGAVDVVVVTPNGSSAIAVADRFTYLSTVPTVTGIGPISGPSTGGTSVVVTGTNFTGATAVNFGTIPATSFTVNSATSITAVSPAGTGTVDVTVVAPNGTSATAAADQFGYLVNPPTLASISPAVGPSTGGTSVTITGTNFTGATAVNFGTIPATSFTLNSATSITAVSPAGTGAVDVTVVTAGGPSATAAVDQFIYGGAVFSGKVLSGALPIKGASVQMYAAGITGYGTGSSVLATSPAAAATDKDGNFSFTYACPTSGAPGDQMYLISTGGDSGNGANSGIVLMAALGTCSSLPLSATVNEVTTVASAYALSAFATINSGGGIAVGAPATASSCTAANNWQSQQANTCNYNGLVRAFQAVNNLVDSTGTARTHTPDYPTNLAGDPNILNNSTVPMTRINALADMLASCVESNVASCGSGLFTAAAATGTPTPGVPAPVTPVDTLQAALNIAQNPGNNVPNLLNLVSSTSPYSITSPDTGTLMLNGTGSPTDLTIALTFTGGGLGLTPTVTLSDGNSYTINRGMAIDAAGNIWVGAEFFNNGNFSFDGMLIAGFNPLGAPITKSTTVTKDSPPVPSYGGYDPDPSANGKSGSGLDLVAMDASGNLWTDDFFHGGATETSTGSLPLTTSNLVGGINAPHSFAFDFTGDLWYGDAGVSEYQANGPGLAGASFGVSGGAGYLAFDSNGGLWTTASNPIPPSQGFDVLQLNVSDGSIAYNAFPSSEGGPGIDTGTPGAGGYLTTLAADGNGNVYGCDPSGLNMDVFNSQATTAPNLLVSSFQIPTQRSCGTQLVLDGNGHIFVVQMYGFGVNSNYKFNFNAIANIDEFTTGGTLISPLANGYTGNSNGEAPTLSPDSFYDETQIVQNGAAIDGSGNLWVLNNDPSGTDPVTFNPIPANALVEYIGIGAPVVTPAAAALTNGLQGVRP